MNGPRKLPIVDSTTVRAVFPSALRVITTLEEMAVGTELVVVSSAIPHYMGGTIVLPSEDETNE